MQLVELPADISSCVMVLQCAAVCIVHICTHAHTHTIQPLRQQTELGVLLWIAIGFVGVYFPEFSNDISVLPVLKICHFCNVLYYNNDYRMRLKYM